MSALSEKAKEIFIALVDGVPEPERERRADEACQGDEELKRRVHALLRAHAEPDSRVDKVAMNCPLTIDNPVPMSERPGTQIGPYKLLQQIGAGGFGVVYMAEQTEPVERRVALKIIKPGMDTQQVIARFEAEEQALAMMDHPNIARVFEVGTTESGRPYFAMELVRGIPITQYCDEHHLTPRQRLELFVPVCHAIQHAHQKGIIHRDIKPTNVLVAEYDDRPVPKIIDFGVAKATQQRLTERTMFTQFGQVVGTIDYMSPEQAKLNELDIDTRSDIYSLGVLLYELLTGETPFDRQRLRSAAFDELLRIIREEEPPRPSTRLSSSHSLPSIAANRQTEPKKLSTLVRGELDWIVMKALEKDRTRRYETANGFANDIQRYLNDEQVVACPPSAAYRFRKFARRNKGPLAVGVFLASATIIAGSFALVAHRRSLRETEARLELRQAELDRREMEVKAEQAERARREHEQARLESERRAKELEAAEQEARFNALVEEAQRLSSGVFPDFPRAEQLLTTAIEQRPDEARLYTYRGSTRYELGNCEDAIVDLERSLKLQPQSNVAAHWLVAMAARQLGQDDKAQQHESLAREQDPNSNELLVSQALAFPYDERGIDLMTQAIERDPFDPLLYFYRGRIAYNLTVRKTAKRHYDLAVSDLEKALRGRPEDPRIMEILCLCMVQFSGETGFSQDYPPPRAKQLLDQWLAIEPTSVKGLSILADITRRSGRQNAAIEICEKGRRLDPTRPEFPFFLAWSHIHLDEYDKALQFLDQTLELRPRPYGHTYPMGYVDVRAVRAMVLAGMGRQAEARQSLQEAGEWEPRECWTFYDWHQLVVSYGELEDFAEVVRWCDEWLRVAPECPTAYGFRGRAFLEMNKLEMALADFSRHLELQPDNSEAWGNWAGVRAQRGEFQLVVDAANEALARKPDAVDKLLSRARALARLGRNSEAIADFTQLIQLRPDEPFHHLERGRAYQASGKSTEAQADFDAYLAPFLTAVSEQSQDWAAWYRRGVAYANLRRHGEAIADFGRALELAPGQVEPLQNQAVNFLETRRWSEGADDLAKLAAGQPSIPWRLHYELALARLAAGDHEAYRAACQRMIQALRETGDPQEATFIAWTCALAAGAIDDYEPAIAFARRAADSDPKSTQFLTTLGAIVYRAGQTQEAIACLTELDRRAAEPSEKANVSPAYAWYFLAMAQHHAGHTDEARSYLEKANAWTTRALEDQENPLPWNRSLTLELLRHEAEKLLGDASDGHGVPESEALPEGESPKPSLTESPKDATEGEDQ